MGKGSRNRQVRIDDKVANPQNYVKKKKNRSSKNWTSIITAAVIILVAVAIVFSAVSTSGTVLRVQRAVSSAHYKVTGTMMQYFAHTVYSNYITQYSNYYSSLLSSYQDYTIYDWLGIDQNQSLSKQVMDKTTGETWFEYFMEQARAQVEELLLYCEGAYAIGMELDEDDQAEIDTTIAYLKAYASYNSVSLSSYLSSLYGKGVKEKDVRAALKLSILAEKFSEKLTEDFHESATAADVDAFYAENESDYLTADYLTYTIDASLTASMTDEELAEAKTAADEAAAALLAATTVEEFREAVRAYLVETLTEDTASEDETKTDETAEDAADDATDDTDDTDDDAKSEIDEKVEEALDQLLVEDFAYTTSTDLGKWIFGDKDNNVEKALVNTTHKIVTDSSTEEKEDDKDEDDDDEEEAPTYTVAVYFLSRAASRDESLTYNISYLALPSTSYKQEDADTALQEFVDAGATKEVLLGMSSKYSSHAGCTSVEDAHPDYFGMDDVDAWVFDADRQAGDYTLVSGTSSSTTYYFIILIDGAGNQVWYADCLDDLVSANVADWLEEAQKTYDVTVNERTLNNVSL